MTADHQSLNWLANANSYLIQCSLVMGLYGEVSLIPIQMSAEVVFFQLPTKRMYTEIEELVFLHEANESPNN